MVAEAYRGDDVTYSAAGGTGGTAGVVSSTNGGAGGNGQVRITFFVTSHALTYMPNGAAGGSVPGDSGVNWIYDTAVTLDGNTGGLERPGYTFAGWNTAADGSGTAYAPGTTVSMRAALTLYARWVPIAAASTAAPGAGQASTTPTPTATARRQALAGRFSLKMGTGTTTGTVPPDVTRITQTATGGGNAAAQGFLEMARAKTATGRCAVTSVRHKKTKKVITRTYRCTIELGKGSWAVTTSARGAGGRGGNTGLLARSTRRVVVK